MGQFRDKFYAEHAGLAYTFPPLESKKRKRSAMMVEPSTRKQRSAGIVALNRVTNLPRSRSISEDSESNTSSHNDEEEEVDWQSRAAPRTSQRRKSARGGNGLFAALTGADMLTESDEEEWVRPQLHFGTSDEMRRDAQFGRKPEGSAGALCVASRGVAHRS